MNLQLCAINNFEQSKANSQVISNDYVIQGQLTSYLQWLRHWR